MTAIEVLSRGRSGRVIEIEYVTDVGEFVRSRGEIRSTLRFIDDAGAKSNLPSTLFFIEPVTDAKTKETVGYRAYGGGSATAWGCRRRERSAWRRRGTASARS